MQTNNNNIYGEDFIFIFTLRKVGKNPFLVFRFMALRNADDQAP